ncbi:MAG: periplasmic heavy metal sensor [Bryobacteraceae bacterium]|nr:periplasmic heavy metal sensor [Bryobacteraceae bacterium]
MLKLTTLTLMMASMALAQPPRPPMAPEPKALIEYLNLTGDQVSRLNAANREAMASMRPVHEQAREKERSIRQLMDAANPDATAVGRAMIEARQLRQKAGQAMTQARETALGVLTAEQRTKLAALEQAAQLQPAIGDAMRFHLLAPPREPAEGGFAPQGRPFGPRPAGFGPPRF